MDNVALLQYGPGGATVVVGARDLHGEAIMHEGEHLSLGERRGLLDPAAGPIGPDG